MKAILEFDLPKDNFEHLAAIKGTSIAAAYDAIDEFCKNQLENNKEKIAVISARAAYENIRNMLRTYAFDNGIDDVVLKV